MKRQHQYHEFGHKQGEIIKKSAKKSTLAFKGGETQETITLSFFSHERLLCCYINFHYQ
jgi:hypothetical protein